ncbi:DNA polymerase III subunit delta [Mesonia aestuariivivens]|uniref:DNA polymerase III subunit delta n=1 Tax=Mesonia aestuariivivens TaxID=2796128 RepID=A0ABS6W3H7_9FLAO|nr:DNA polymerase III subunit delta [Mesonia aestuariivivens]MBW2962051.1 DNA polymerase III subunit delta [Mesonia aestuariivivens]
MEQVKKIIADIKKDEVKPIYFLMGEEPYYIDSLASYFEKNLLTEEEKGFNQSVLYGRDVSIDDIVSSAKRFPMMAKYQLLIVKEAQDLSRSIEKLVKYAENPQPSTVLVICYKYKKLDKRKALYKTLNKSAEVFESKPLYDNQIPDWIAKVLRGKNYTITPKASLLLVEFLGTDLGKINNELEKLQLILPEGSQITPELIEENIGISKDFNNFELQKALGEKDFKKAFRIIDYFSQNPREHPVLQTTAILFSFFTKILKYHSLNNQDKANVAKTLGVNPFFVKDYAVAARNYKMKEVSGIVEKLREVDAKSKGVGANGAHTSDLFKELLIKVSLK